MKEMTMDARTENLHTLFGFIVEETKRLGLDGEKTRQCKLCAEEVFLNISSYAYKPGSGQVTVTMDSDSESDDKVKLVMTFCDEGQPFNPLELSDPDTESNLYDRQLGGLGIYLVKQTMDKVDYRYEDGKNILTIEKSFAREV